MYNKTFKVKTLGFLSSGRSNLMVINEYAYYDFFQDKGLKRTESL